MSRFECRKTFVLDSGKLSRTAETMLTKKAVTRVPGHEGAYYFKTTVEAPTIGDAGIVSRDDLLEILRPYGVEIIVTDSHSHRIED